MDLPSLRGRGCRAMPKDLPSLRGRGCRATPQWMTGVMRWILIGDRRQPYQTLWRQMQVRVLHRPRAPAGWQQYLPKVFCSYHVAATQQV